MSPLFSPDGPKLSSSSPPRLRLRPRLLHLVSGATVYLLSLPRPHLVCRRVLLLTCPSSWPLLSSTPFQLVASQPSPRTSRSRLVSRLLPQSVLPWLPELSSQSAIAFRHLPIAQSRKRGVGCWAPSSLWSGSLRGFGRFFAAGARRAWAALCSCISRGVCRILPM